jgi:citrate lyase subunit beta/citryl-CoA lyase
MLIRSYLYAPANRPDLLAKVATRGADAIVIDLEDAVPAAEKQAARRAAAAFLSEHDAQRMATYVRVNAGEHALADLAELPLHRITGIRLPKVEDPGLVARVDAVLAAADTLSHRVVLHPLVESVQGLFGLDEIARSSSRIERFIFGAGDYVLNVAGEATAERLETLYARSHLVARSRLLGLAAPIAHVYTPIADLDGLARACRTDRAMGFYGRSCIHPTQVAVINEAFAFGPREVERARRMVDGYRDGVRQGRGAVVVEDGSFVDEAGYKRALRVLEVAAAQREAAAPRNEAS